MISGGVITEANTNMTTIACLRYRFRKSDDTNPSFARKNTINGNSKTTPEAKVSVDTNDTYDCIVKWLTMLSVSLKLIKKFTDKGANTKYPNNTPTKNSREVARTIPVVYFCSVGFKAGLKNRQNSHNIYGADSINPMVNETTIK